MLFEDGDALRAFAQFAVQRGELVRQVMIRL